MMKLKLKTIAAAVMAGLSAPVFALNILVSNDDGLTSNLKALYERLKAEGHDVIISVPCSGQSGRGAAIVMYSSSTIDATNDSQITSESGCHNGAAPIGAPSVGPFTKAGFTNGDYHYVHGTPVMATMYGLDILAQQRWGKAPDLVISGPNEGQNVGHIIVSSGTVSNAQFAASRGIPAVALSAGTDTVDNSTLANPNSAIVADLSITLLRELEYKAQKYGGALLPGSIALNVNFPNAVTATTPFVPTRVGSFDLYNLKFVTSPYIGLGYTLNDPRAATAAQANDESVVVANHKIAVTPMQVGYEAIYGAQVLMSNYLDGLF
ncbi:MAG TPA: 5'/3'-nucleotidase SurE [Candidatus Competibacteraceae bacterium]|nr:5'/3'-nucleotidase SurE [Candidatus Competibacteraceae bacterium]HQD55315.1 5'/3'-nucleotidase SurE [Candidatus Competibacteraceae bacterium]